MSKELTTEEWQANAEAYKKEAELAFSIADRIPKNPAEQDRRSRNRFREHFGEGHTLVNSGRVSHHQPNHTFHTCACGWIGWLIPKADA